MSAYATQSWVNTQLANYQGKIHFLNTKNNNAEASFSYLHLPLTSNAGHAELNLSDWQIKSLSNVYNESQQAIIMGDFVPYDIKVVNGVLTVTYGHLPYPTVYWEDIEDKPDVVTALGVSGDYLTYTKNGLDTNLTVPFATRASQLNGRLGREYAMIGKLATNIDSNSDLDSFLLAGTYTCQAGSIASTLSNTPYTAGNFRLWHIVNTGEDSDTGQWSAQLLLAPNSPRFYLRGHQSTGFTAWHEIAFRDDLKFYNTKNGSARVDTVNNIYLPLTVGTGSGTGNVSLDLSDYATTSALNTALAGYLPLTAGSGKPLTGILWMNADLVMANPNNKTNDSSQKIAFYTNKNYPNISPYIQAIYEGSHGRKRLSVFQKNVADWDTPQVEVFTILPNGNVGIGTTSPAEKLDVAGNVKAYGATLTNLLSWNVQNADNLVISNNKIQMSVSGTPHNIVLFEGSTANMTSYAKFYERPMVKTGTNNGTPVYTNVALVSEVEAKQDIIHFQNTNNNDSEVGFSYLHLPLTNIGAGHASLDLSSYMPLSGDSIKTGKLAVGTTAFDGSNAKLQVGGNMFATGSITSKSSAGSVTLGNGNISATNLYISTVVFGTSNNDPAIYIGNGHVYARNSQGQTTMII
jgi:hypothetical protein